MCFGLSSKCLFTCSLSCWLSSISTLQRCNLSFRNALRSIRGRGGLLDALITFMLHLCTSRLGITRFFDMRLQPFAHSHSVLGQNCRSKSSNTSPAAILTGAKIRQDRRKNVGYCNLWSWAVSSLELSSYRGSKGKADSSMVSSE